MFEILPSRPNVISRAVALFEIKETSSLSCESFRTLSRIFYARTSGACKKLNLPLVFATRRAPDAHDAGGESVKIMH